MTFRPRNSFELLAAAITEVVRETPGLSWRDRRNALLECISDEDLEEFLSWFEKDAEAQR